MTQSIYQDSKTLWHDKPTVNGKPSSQNWMIFTAYAKALGLPYDEVRARRYFDQCVSTLRVDKILINRHPNLLTPPLSFDEVMGASFLGFIDYDILKANHFVYIGAGKPLEDRLLERLSGALIEYLAPKIIVKGFSVTIKKPKLNDRNRWWREEMENVRHFAARLTPDKTYILKRFNNRDFHIEEEKFYAFHRECVMKSGIGSKQEQSTRNMMWLMMIMNGDHRAKNLKPWESFEAYFGADHDFTKAIKNMYGVKG